ncbi:MAG TPA: ComEC/Rec2 family competence protein [Gordonia sp. (in: high G+C Gram-positive bacteria)]|mgnify:CR=1 FL=1|nr:ComEC/Rec2 family competence protein [Gordonia sp. (in: high G+C Gram-positive bacteria)]
MAAEGVPVLDLRLACPAAACWSVTWIGLEHSRSALTVTILVAIGLLVSGVLAGVARGWQPPSRGRWFGMRTWFGTSLVVATAGLAFGTGVALLVRADRVDAHPLRQLDGGSVAVVLSATEDPRVSGANPDLVWVRARVHAADGRTVTPADVLVFASSQSDKWLGLRVGERVRALVTVRVPDGRGLVVAALTARGPPTQISEAPGYLRLAETVRSRFRELCATALGHRKAGLLPGLVVGDTSAGEATVDEQFRRAGLTHLLAVSGANFALIVGMAVLLAGVIGGSVRLTVGAGLLATVGFAVLVQLSPSVIRAAAMGGIGLLAMAASRRRAAMPALAAAVVVALLVWPGLAVDVGFAMSVAATAALIAVSPRLRDRLVDRGMPRGIADAVAMATVAYLVTAPLVAAISGQISVTAVIANLLVAPAVPVATLLGAAAMLLAAPGVPVLSAAAAVLVAACAPALWWILTVARWLGGPWATIPAAPASLLGIGGAVLVVGAVRHRRTGPHLARLRRDATAASAPWRQRLPDRARRLAGRLRRRA